MTATDRGDLREALQGFPWAIAEMGPITSGEINELQSQAKQIYPSDAHAQRGWMAQRLNHIAFHAVKVALEAALSSTEATPSGPRQADIYNVLSGMKSIDQMGNQSILLKPDCDIWAFCAELSAVLAATPSGAAASQPAPNPTLEQLMRIAHGEDGECPDICDCACHKYFGEASQHTLAARTGEAQCATCKGERVIQSKPAGAGHSDDLAEYHPCPQCVVKHGRLDTYLTNLRTLASESEDPELSDYVQEIQRLVVLERGVAGEAQSTPSEAQARKLREVVEAEYAKGKKIWKSLKPDRDRDRYQYWGGFCDAIAFCGAEIRERVAHDDLMVATPAQSGAAPNETLDALDSLVGEVKACLRMSGMFEVLGASNYRALESAMKRGLEAVLAAPSEASREPLAALIRDKIEAVARIWCAGEQPADLRAKLTCRLIEKLEEAILPALAAPQPSNGVGEPPRKEYFATGYTREELQAMHPKVELRFQNGEDVLIQAKFDHYGIGSQNQETVYAFVGSETVVFPAKFVRIAQPAPEAGVGELAEACQRLLKVVDEATEFRVKGGDFLGPLADIRDALSRNQRFNDPNDPDSELVIDDQPPHRAITVGELRRRASSAKGESGE